MCSEHLGQPLMKKQELIHVHTLLAEVATHWHEQGQTLDLSSYHQQDIHPMAMSEAKAEHEAAVLALAGGIARSLGDELEDDGDSVAASPERPQSSV